MKHWRCRQCERDAASARRYRNRALLQAEAGGKCIRCGYQKSAAALQFHHRDPSLKAFELKLARMGRSLAILRLEAAKCDLLCGNCHAEEEERLWLETVALRPAGELPGRITDRYGCSIHGMKHFREWASEDRIYRRCQRCSSEGINRLRRRTKEELVAELGGRCRLCGYNASRGALHFHHRDPSEKLFEVGKAIGNRSLAVVSAEAAKCDLLCSNCHAESHEIAA